MDKKKLQEFLARLQEMATELNTIESEENTVVANSNGVSTMSLSDEENIGTTASVGNASEYKDYIKIILSDGREIAADQYFALEEGDYIIVEVDYLGLISNKIYETRAELTFYERTRLDRLACSVYSLNNNEYYGDIQGVNNFYKIDLYELYSLYGTANFKLVAGNWGLSSAFIYNVSILPFFKWQGVYGGKKFYDDNKRPKIKQYEAADLAQVNYYAEDGIMSVTFTSFEEDDYILPIYIGHVYKHCSGKTCYGLNWRLNLDRKLTVSTDDTEKTTIYIYTDEMGDKYTFSEKYYYYNDSGNRVFVDKDVINVNISGELTYEGNNIYTYQSCNGYNLISEVDDYINSELIDQRQEEYAQIEDYILQTEPSLNAYVKVTAGSGEIVDRLSSLTKNCYEEFISDVTSTSENIILTESQAMQLKSLYMSKAQLASQSDQLDTQLEQYDLQKAELENQREQLEFQVNTQLHKQKEQLQKTKTLAIKIYPNTDFSNFNLDSVKITSEEYIESKYTSEADKQNAEADRNRLIAKTREQVSFQNADENLGMIDKQITFIEEQIDCLSDSINKISTLKDLINEQKISLNEQNAFIQSQIDYIILQARSNLNLIKDAFIVFFRQKAQLELLDRQMPVNYIKDSNGVISGFNKKGNLVMLFDAYGNDVTIEYNSDELITGIYLGNVKKFSFVYVGGILQSICDSRGRTVKYSYDAERLSTVTFADGRKLKFDYNSDMIEYITSDNGQRQYLMYDPQRRMVSVKNQAIPSTVPKLENGSTQNYSELISEYKIAYSSLHLKEKYITISDNEDNYQKIDFGSSYNIIRQETRYNTGCVKVNDYTYKTLGGREIITNEQINDEAPVTKTKKYNEISQLIYEIFDWKILSASTREKSRVDYSYDINNRLVKAVTVKTVETSGVEETHTSITNYSYNAQGKMILSESYVEGEELTSGKTYEERVYDEKGNLLKTICWNSLDSSSKFYSESEVSENGQVIADKDETGAISAEYEYVADSNVVNAIKYPNGSKLSYGRNPYNFAVTSVTRSTEEGEASTNDIIYENNLPVQVTSGNTVIKYTYDEKGTRTSYSIDGVQQAMYSYTSYSKDGNTVSYRTATQTLADGTVIVTSKTGIVDSEGRVKVTESVKADNVVILSTLYNVDGLVEQISDKVSGTITYTYDNYKNVTKATMTNNSATVLTEEYKYNGKAELMRRVLTGVVNQTYSYSYKDNSTRNLKYIGYGTYKFFPLTDVYGRNTGRGILNGSSELAAEYITYRKVGDHATNMPATVWFGNGNVVKENIKYKYDSCGNIAEITQNGHLVARYKYDSVNRLVREDNKVLNKTVLFTYDMAGNITERCEYAYTSKEGDELSELECAHFDYDYDRDRLINYNGERFAYNSLGNPTIYRGKVLEWQYGNRLTRYGEVWFAYDGQGKRTSKNNITFTYDSNGNLLKQSNGLEFIYDNSGVIGVKYNNTQYFYRRDAQGNIIAILDNNGNVVVKYYYDAWGNHTVQSAVRTDRESGIGVLNPFRYRGYYYDTETELYFLQTRYYDPKVGRFISRDSIEYADPETINGLNLYAYCGNNPVMNVDPSGTFFWSIFIGAIIVGALFGGISGGVSAVQNGQSLLAGVLVGALTGAVTGAALGLGGALGAAAFVAGTAINVGTALVALGGTIAGSFAAGIGIYALETHLYGGEFKWSEALMSGGFLALESAMNFGIGLLLGAKGYWPQNKQVYKGLINKLTGSVKFMASNVKIIMERIYLKSSITVPIVMILNGIKGDYFE